MIQIWKSWDGSSWGIDRKKKRAGKLSGAGVKAASGRSWDRQSVYFADVVHFVRGLSMSCLWSLTQIFVPAPSGRNGYNVLGVVDALPRDLVAVCNAPHINALIVCELLKPVTSKHLGSGISVTIIPDSARYRRCNYAMEKAKLSGMELLFCLRAVRA